MKENNPSLPSFPRLIFLDTNIVQNLMSFGEYFYDGYLSPKAEMKIRGLGKKGTEDVDALAQIMDLGRRAGWPLVAENT
jgi:hypothetical protein